MLSKRTRAIIFGIVMFLAFTITKPISGKALLDVQTFLPGLVGGLVGGLVVYFFSGLFTKNKK